MEVSIVMVPPEHPKFEPPKRTVKILGLDPPFFWLWAIVTSPLSVYISAGKSISIANKCLENEDLDIQQLKKVLIEISKLPKLWSLSAAIMYQQFPY